MESGLTDLKRRFEKKSIRVFPTRNKPDLTNFDALNALLNLIDFDNQYPNLNIRQPAIYRDKYFLNDVIGEYYALDDDKKLLLTEWVNQQIEHKLSLTIDMIDFEDNLVAIRLIPELSSNENDDVYGMNEVLMMYDLDSKNLSIKKFCFAEAALRGYNAGSAALLKIESLAKRFGAESIEVYGPALSTLGFYEKLGYIEDLDYVNPKIFRKKL